MKYMSLIQPLLGAFFVATGCAPVFSRDGNYAPQPLSASLSMPQNIVDRVAFEFPLDEDGAFEISSRNEVCVARRALRNFDGKAPFSPSMRGDLILEGTPFEMHALPGLKQEVSVNVEKILFGGNEHLPLKISLITPWLRYGGINFAIGEHYKMLLIHLRGNYYTWATAGSAPTDTMLSDFYKCTEENTLSISPND